MGIIRILLIADTHLGFDLPFQPRIKRRRRGHDFFSNFERALAPALKGKVDCVVHGGDILFRSKVPAQLVDMAFKPLKKIADTGIPVYVVPGNHERSSIPCTLLANHPGIHIFSRPKTFTFQKNGYRLALAGFPYQRDNVRKHLPDLLEQTGWHNDNADGSILCMHHCFEGATIGPNNYTFRYDDDVIRAADIPEGFIALLSGHIHRHQVLATDLQGRPLAAPVFYPGSVERTTFAEKDEKKGYIILEIETGAKSRGSVKRWRFHELPARPMKRLELNAEGISSIKLASWIKNSVRKFPVDSIVQCKLHGTLTPEALNVISASSIRALVPQTMNVSTIPVDHIHYSGQFGRNRFHERQATG